MESQINKKERDGKIYALYMQGLTYKEIKAKFNIPVKELRIIVKIKAIGEIYAMYPDLSQDEIIWRAIRIGSLNDCFFCKIFINLRRVFFGENK